MSSVPAARRTLRVSTTLLVAPLLACVLDHGAGWQAEQPDAGEAVSIVLVGDPLPGATSKKVAAQLDRTLAAEREQGRAPLVLWLGNQLAPGCLEPPDDPWNEAGMRELGAVVSAHVEQGGQSFALMGHRDWRCPVPQIRAASRRGIEARRWNDVVGNAVLRVDASGAVRTVSSCAEDGSVCNVESPRDGDLVDLVVVDTISWVFPAEPGSPKDLLARRSLDEQEKLLEAMADTEGPPRILVTHIPIESAGIHGQGGLRPSATFDRFPPHLRSAIQRGEFVGVFSAHERDLEVTADISPAIQRSAKTWIEAPLFQVTSGAAGLPDRHAPGPRTTPGFQGVALHPDLRSSHAGFAQVLIDPERVDVVVHARRNGQWDRGVVSFPLDRAPHPAETPGIVQTPCLRCDPLDGASSGPQPDLQDGRW